jgi:RNA polymerase sigma-70 factor (ECF subfamily)
MTDSRGMAPGGAARAVDWRALSDRQLTARLKQGEEAAYEELLRRYQLKIYSLARGLTRNEQDARDAMQDAFVSVLKHVRRFRGDSSLSTWIYRIAVNAALMKVRGRRRDHGATPVDASMPTFDATGHRVAALPDWHPSADQVLLNKELGGLLRRWIAELPPDHRSVLVLRDQEGLSNEEVAAITRLSIPAVKSRLHRARIFLRERAKGYVHAAG